MSKQKKQTTEAAVREIRRHTRRKFPPPKRRSASFACADSRGHQPGAVDSIQCHPIPIPT